ncbi:MAG TPA: anti-sigma factor [Saprospiraceae bacterium]|nr:anti-sigma factor [Saprospiraceae bacterium]
MDIEEIRSSGLLELYAMDQLSPAEKAEVESYLLKHPELRNELHEIGKSLELFAASASVNAPSGLKERILDSIRTDVRTDVRTKTYSPGLWPAVAALFGLGLLLLGYLFYQKDQDTKQLSREITVLRDTCDATTNQLTEQLNILRQLTLPGNKILPFAATPGFAQTDLYFHTNKDTKKNFIQVRNLPDIADNQTFQLWSIKPNQAPAPLNVFDIPVDGLIEVEYIDGTETYAITIEPEGGRETPTLENLIGTVGVTGI